MNSHISKLLIMAALAASGSLAAHDDSGLYIGGSLGSAELDEDFSGINVDTDSNAYSIFGGLQIGSNLAIEGGYVNLGDFSEQVDLGGILSRAEFTGDGYTLGARLAFPMSSNLSIYARGGIFFWDSDVVIDGFSFDTPGDENPYLGGGLKVDLNDNFSLLGEWTHYEFDAVDTDVLSIGFQYLF